MGIGTHTPTSDSLFLNKYIHITKNIFMKCSKVSFTNSLEPTCINANNTEHASDHDYFIANSLWQGVQKIIVHCKWGTGEKEKGRKQ